MRDLLAEMRACKTTTRCIDLATTDAYGEYEEAAAWHACIETLFGRFEQVRVLGEDVHLEGFDLVNDLAVVAVCRKGRKRAKVPLGSVEFPKLTAPESLWLKAWKKWSHAE